jgi:hypothetical protein
MLAMASALAVPTHSYRSSIYADRDGHQKPREPTQFDLERIAQAKVKRKRKAERKNG